MKRGLDIPIIRYANCWEDATVLLQALNVGPKKRFISIASGGDNTLSLLLLDPELVVGFDLNAVQLYLCELKTTAIQHLEYEECVAFLGFAASQKRLNTYDRIKEHLSEECRRYFDKQKKSIRTGIIKTGKFEKYFSKFRRWIMPWIHGRRSIRKLLAPKSQELQEKYYTHGWNTKRWQWLFRLFYSRTVMGFFGRSPRFHRYVEFNVGDFIYKRAARHLASVRCQDNEYLHFIFKGYFTPRLPVYMRRENFGTIKSRLGKLQWVVGDTTAALNACGAVDGCNLSDIFEYMSTEQTAEQAALLTAQLRSGGRIAYWNLMVNRQLADHSETIRYQEQLSQDLQEQDKGFFYNGIIVNEKI